MENLLATEKSPYLLQHKDNPVHWMPWGEAAFERARRENKPVFLSVGYSTCHWCHVMAHECFEDVEVAQVLNANFVSVKVDREELPDVDQIYMSALQSLSGGGGWPMSVWLTSDAKPFFAGTYFPKYRFMQLLRRIQEIWSTERDKLMADSERLLATVQRLAQTEATDSDPRDAEHEQFLKSYTNHFREHFDARNGGFGGAPKFPQTMNLMVMMRQDFAAGLREAETMVNGTLGKMLRGGVYDQLVGGFHRYSVDEEWLVPHFEKMLYDQALLVVTLTEAYQMYGDGELKRGARETLDYVLAEMTHPEGGFYSAQDADSLNPASNHMDEGYFCTFSFEELEIMLTAEELRQVERVYGVTEAGNFEGRNILHLQPTFDGRDTRDPVLLVALSKMRQLRKARAPAHLDDKIIASWNGWMIWAMVKAGLAFRDGHYLEAARKAMGFVRERLWSNGKLHRFWRDGEAKGRASAEDYASLIHACLELYQADFDGRWAEWALELQKILDTQFWDVEDGAYFSNDGRDKLLPFRPKDDYDGVSPCSNSMATLNLHRLYLLTGDATFKRKAERIIANLFGRLQNYPSGLPFLALAMDYDLAASKVAVLNGNGWVTEFYQKHAPKFNPHLFWARADTGWPVTLGKTGSAPTLYMCEEGHCLKPATSAAECEAVTNFAEQTTNL